MGARDVDDLNAGYASLLLDDYLENPDSVPVEWRRHFEAAAPELLASHPGLRRLLDALGNGDGAHAPAAPTLPAAAPAPAEPPQTTEPDDVLLGGVAAAMALVKAHRMHGHLAARLDPLGSEPPGDPALEPERLEPRLTEELMRQIPAKVLRVHVPRSEERRVGKGVSSRRGA